MSAIQNRKAHIIGGGVAGLAAAVYLVRDGRMPGKNVRIYEAGQESDRQQGRNALGGALDATGDAGAGYVMRGGRMFEKTYFCTYDMLSGIPTIANPNINVRDDIFNFTKEAGWNSTARLINGKNWRVDVSSMGLNLFDIVALTRLVYFRNEDSLGRRRIDQVFGRHFFKSNFWLMWASMFSFEPWHSAVEMKRYLRRFFHLFPTIGDLSCVQHTRLNQYESMIMPLQAWLGSQGVAIEPGARVYDIAFAPKAGGFCASSLLIKNEASGVNDEIVLGEDDLVFFTNGSITDAATHGSMTAPAPFEPKALGGAWTLWKKLVERETDKEFGNPSNFLLDPNESKWVSFTVTTRTPLFAERIRRWTRRRFGTEGLLTFKNSKWLLTIHPHFSPAYQNQPQGVDIWWGYGLNPDGVGDFVRKRMSDCSGSELLEESLRQLGCDDAEREEILAASTVIPCMMPYITSQFMPRMRGDRPKVVPDGSTNFAFLGQYTELPDDVVFTVEYSVRSARTAVYSLLNLNLEIPPVFTGHDKFPAILDATQMVFS